MDNGIADVHMHIDATDEVATISLKGTIYVASRDNYVVFYFNPVYQTSNGEVYAVSGEGASFDDFAAFDGEFFRQTITENSTETYGDTETSYGTEVEVVLCAMEESKSTAILQFNGNNELLSKNEYAPENLPERIVPISDTQYIIVETTSTDGVSRTLFGRADESIFAFSCRDDGICIKRTCEISWEG